MYIAFLIHIIFSTKDDIISLIIYTVIFLFVTLNDNFRSNCFYNSKCYYVSFLISLFMSSIVVYLVKGYLYVYLYMLLIESAYIKDRKISKIFYILNAFIIILIPTIIGILLEEVGVFQFIKTNMVEYLMMLLFLAFNTVTIFSYRGLAIEKARVEKLNKEIKELTITEERNRVAQEIHDNLGHNLIGLNMNLDVAGNMIGKDEDKLKEIICKCQNLTKESMESLRMAVYALKEESFFEEFIKSIEKLIGEITDTSNINIEYDIDKNIEDYPANYKKIIYTSIKESLTNSIKHGQVSEIYIGLKIKDKVSLIVSDNGIGCKDIIKSNGLTGIEDRVAEVQGSVEYITEVGKGFKIDIKLPAVNE